MNFEELQQAWRSQPVDAPKDTDALRKSIAGKWARQQKHARISNIATTIAFAATFVVFGWVYLSFHADHGLYFTGSIIFMSILMLMYLVVLWKGVTLQKEDPTLPANIYAAQQLRVLRWRRKTMTHYVWIYAVLLWLGLMAYFADVLREATTTFKLSAMAITTAYIFGMVLVTRLTKQKKRIAQIDELIHDMEQLTTTD